MDFTFTGIKTWATENPLTAAAVGLGITGAIALAVSPKARKMVGLGSLPSRRIHRKKTKKVAHAKAKSLFLR
jgi:hypothetical protein